MKKYNIVKEATALVENQLQLLSALYQAKQTMAAGRSRLVCRCGGCKASRQITLAWIESLLCGPTSKETTRILPAYSAPATSDASPSSD